MSMTNVKQKIIYSGIQPSGEKHLGNYLGAIKQYVEYQNKPDTQLVLCIANVHSTTVEYSPQTLQAQSLNTAALLLAAGINPSKTILYRQSDVGSVLELSVLLGSVTAQGELNNMHQFKSKSSSQRQLVSLALYTYPVLMTADMLAFGAEYVPVGEDQKQHMELTADIAQRFNKRFGKVFHVPKAIYPDTAARVMDLQTPTQKMSTSNPNTKGVIRIGDEPRVVQKKFAKAQTDALNLVDYDFAKRPGISNLIEIIANLENRSIDSVLGDYKGQSTYGGLKKHAADAVEKEFAQIREEYVHLQNNPQMVQDVLLNSRAKAQDMVSQTIEKTKSAMGLL